MTLLFAALLGNFLAWCVHSLAWWLRERALTFIGVVGIVCALCFAYGSAVAVSVILRKTDDVDWTLPWPLALPISAIAFVAVSVGWQKVALIWLIKISVSWRQASLARNSQRKSAPRLSFFAFFSEIVIAVLAWWIMIPVNSSPDSFPIYSWFFWSTFLILALIRPQVVKVQKWLWQQVKPQRATNE